MELDMNNFVVREEGSTDIDYTYDLFSVMIHSGGALGGHYFAFIKSFSSGKWYKFNDASVTEIENAEIELMYGQDAHKITSGTDDEVCFVLRAKSMLNDSLIAYYHLQKPKPLNNAAFSTNAYMLMYRRRDASKNNNTAPQPQDIPDYIQEMIAKENEEFERSRAEYIKRRDAVPLSVFYEPKAFSVAQSGDLPEGKYPSVQITMDKHDSLEQTIVRAL
jgi:ubiquitin carboxyl-terminal hydrolase 47